MDGALTLVMRFREGGSVHDSRVISAPQSKSMAWVTALCQESGLLESGFRKVYLLSKGGLPGYLN